MRTACLAGIGEAPAWRTFLMHKQGCSQPVCRSGSRVESLAGACTASGRGLFAGADRRSLPHGCPAYHQAPGSGFHDPLAADSFPPCCEAAAAAASAATPVSTASPGLSTGMRLGRLPVLILVVWKRPAPDAPRYRLDIVVLKIAFCDDRPLFNGIGNDPFVDVCLSDTHCAMPSLRRSYYLGLR